MSQNVQPAGWYYAQGDPAGTQRYWDGAQWQGAPRPTSQVPQAQAQQVQQPQAQQPQQAQEPQQAQQSQQPYGQQAAPQNFGQQQQPQQQQYGQPQFGQAPAQQQGQQPGQQFQAPQQVQQFAQQGQAGQPGYGQPNDNVPFVQQQYGNQGAQSDFGSSGDLWWKRMLARIVDWFVWFLLIIPVGLLMLGGAFSFSGGSSTSFVLTVLGTLLNVLLIAAYEIGMPTFAGATLGKMLLGIKIVGEDGEPMNPVAGLTRISPYLGLTFLGLIPFVNILAGFLIYLALPIASLIMILIDDQKGQALWDKLAKTMVVNK